MVVILFFILGLEDDTFLELEEEDDDNTSEVNSVGGLLSVMTFLQLAVETQTILLLFLVSVKVRSPLLLTGSCTLHKTTTSTTATTNHVKKEFMLNNSCFDS